MSRKNRSADRTLSKIQRRHRRYGWTALAIFMGLGLLLEGLLGFKSGYLLEDTVKREFWRLSHSHGTLFALVNLLYANLSADEEVGGMETISSWMLVVGSILLPLGFFLGGFSPAEGDPGIGIIFVPAGALFVMIAAGIHAYYAWRN